MSFLNSVSDLFTKNKDVTGRGIVSGTGSSGGTVTGTQTQSSSTASTASSTTGDDTESSSTDKRYATSSNAVYLGFKLYIEGEECPFESASISFGVSMLPMMTLQLMPYKSLRNLEERTKVHFYFIDPADGEERLLFDGEISGVGYTKNPTAQTLTYSVTHVSNYLNEILMSFFDISAYATTFPPIYTSTLGAEMETDYSTYEYSTLGKILDVKSLEGLGSFQEMFTRIFDEIFKVKSGEDGLSKTLQYYKDRTDEWRLRERMAALPPSSEKVDTVFKLKDFIASENTVARLQEEVKKLDGFHSVFEILNEIFRQILYHPIILPSPYLYESEQLQAILYKPQALFVLPPICNVIWPSMYTVFSYSQNYKSVPTRLFARAGIGRLLRDKKEETAVMELAAQYFWAPQELRDEIAGTVLSAKAVKTVETVEAAGDVLAKYAWTMAITDVKVSEVIDIHKSLLDCVSKQEEAVGIRLGQPANNDFFTRYVEWLVSGDYKGKTKDYAYSKDSEGEKVENAADKVGQLADYELTRQQFETEVVSMVMVFNPYLAPGFPTLVMDRPESGMHVYGYISGMTHTISAAGGCSTTADIAYIHQYDDIFRDTKTGKAVKRFVVAEDIWADEDAVYESILGVKSIKSADFNTIDDAKEKDDPTKIAENIAENMAEDDFHDYVYNAYLRSGRKIVTKAEYDSFMGDIEYNKDVQGKVRQYRSWIENRVAASPSMGDVEAAEGDETVASGTDTTASSTDTTASSADTGTSTGTDTTASSADTTTDSASSAGTAGPATESGATTPGATIAEKKEESVSTDWANKEIEDHPNDWAKTGDDVLETNESRLARGQVNVGTKKSPKWVDGDTAEYYKGNWK